ncbi:hypothetical protein PENVUL_c015G05892 [Penicillium vulpinum]|uniref:Uncharacterized protein n=1 Tax=Penicillium vulpinum TaxID=29845 RepID=A0A1V6RYR3_9EURO|nr:hypothetical protein PENVUL_c015G05892 [Penicillium vulpinum]
MRLLPGTKPGSTPFFVEIVVPQPSGRRTATGGVVPGEQPVIYDAQACVNLTIYASAKGYFDDTGLSMPKKLLWVLVYMHGRLWFHRRQRPISVHDTTKTTEPVAREPIGLIIVSIDYQLNWQGFIACYELLDDQEAWRAYIQL